MAPTEVARRRHPGALLVGVAAAVGCLLFVVLRVMAHDGDITSLIRIGEEMTVDRERPDDLAVVEDSVGYDGQFYYRQSLDPLSLDDRIEGIPLDRPAYRSLRIGYPGVVWAVTGGGTRSLVPWAMAGVNIACVGLIALLGARFAEDVGRAPTWGLAFAAWPGFLVATAYDLAEPLEAALVLAGLLALRRERTWLAAVALTGAVLTRESALIIPLAIIAAAVLRLLRHRLPAFVGVDARRHHLLAAAVPVSTYVAMQLWMTQRWSESAAGPVEDSAEHVRAVPFQHFVSAIYDTVTAIDSLGLFQLVQLLIIVAMFAFFVVAMKRAPDAGTTVERVGLVGALLLVSTLGGWDRMVVYLRWPDLAVMLGLIVYLACPPERLPQWADARTVSRAFALLFISALPIWIVI